MDIAAACRHCGFSTKYINHNLLHQSKLGGDVQLQNTHIDFFKSPRDLHQFATSSILLGLGSALVDWCRDTTSVPFGHILIHLSPRTVDHLRYCTNSGYIPLKFYVPANLKHLKHLHDEHTTSLYSPRLPTLSAPLQNSVSKNLSKRNYPFSQQVHRQPAARKLASCKKKSSAKVQRQNSRTVFKKNNLDPKKRIASHKNNFPLRH